MLVFLNSEKDSDIKVCDGGLSSYFSQRKNMSILCFPMAAMALLSTSI
jgi:hypothetical protein